MYKIFTRILCRQLPYALNVRPGFKSIIAVLLFVLACNTSLAQAQTIKLKANNISYDQVFREIKKQTGYDIVFISNRVKTTLKTNVNFANTPLKDALNTLLNPLRLEYVIQNKTIVIREQSADPALKEPAPPSGEAQLDVRGRVFNEKREPLPGASVTIQGTGRSMITDKDGNFFVPNTNAGQVFMISFIGYKT